MSTKKAADAKKLWIRVLSIVLAVIMIGSTLLAAMGLF